MQRPASDMTQEEANHLCQAASAVYFEIVQLHASRTGIPAVLPELLCPRGEPPRCVRFDDRTLWEAERFLLRLGLIACR